MSEQRGRASRSTALLAIASVTLALAALAVAAISILAGGEEEGEEATPRSEPVVVELSAVAADGEDARGLAEIGVDEELAPYLELTAENVPAPGREQILLVWISGGEGRGLPLPTPVGIDERGTIAERIALAPQLIPVIETGRAIEIVAVGVEELRRLSREVERVGAEPAGPDEAEALARRPGPALLRGVIPAPG